MKNPNILMLHRIELSSHQAIEKLYHKRNMVYSINELFKMVDCYLEKGLKFGSIKHCLSSQEYFHLSFDDGFKEHLEVAILLKERYSLNYHDMSFSINVNNSFKNIYSGMDIVYSLIEQNKKLSLCNFIGIKKDNNCIIENIKNKLSKSKPSFFIKLNNQFKLELKKIKKIFLNKNEVIKLSKLFQINSHGIYHRFLTFNKQYGKVEIIDSKNIIEKIINKQINTFCFPEGKNDYEIQEYCKEAGYKYALSIRHEKNNLFCIGRKAI